MEITHLVTVGCSWTYCQGLADPKTQGWPALLANKLGVPVVNLALPGIGNDAIHRLTYEYFFQDLPNNSKPVYVIAWSQTWRREAWCRQIYSSKSVTPGYALVPLPEKPPFKNIEKALLDTWSEEDFYRRTLLFRQSVDSLFKSRNVPNLTTFFSHPENQNTGSVEKKYSNVIEYLKNNTNLAEQDFIDVVKNYPKLPCGHEGYDAMPVLAEYAYQQLLKIHGSLTPVPGKYMTLKEFVDIDMTGLMESVWK